MFTCLIIDDEQSALEVLSDYISDQPELHLLNSYNNPINALNEIKNLQEIVDVIFLDIEMPGMNGIELAKLIRHKANKIVFTTAHQGYAYASYEMFADGFLLKPISQTKFKIASKKLFEENLESPFLVKSILHKNRLVNIDVSSIIAVEAALGGVKIHTIDQEILSSSSLSEIAAQLLKRKGFHKIHRSFIISGKYIKILERSFVVLKNELRIPIGRKFLDSYRQIAKKN